MLASQEKRVLQMLDEWEKESQVIEENTAAVQKLQTAFGRLEKKINKLLKGE